MISEGNFIGRRFRLESERSPNDQQKEDFPKRDPPVLHSSSDDGIAKQNIVKKASVCKTRINPILFLSDVNRSSLRSELTFIENFRILNFEVKRHFNSKNLKEIQSEKFLTLPSLQRS